MVRQAIRLSAKNNQALTVNFEESETNCVFVAEQQP